MTGQFSNFPAFIRHSKFMEKKMQYMMLIYWNQLDDAERSPAELKAQLEAYRAYTQEVKEREIMLHADALEPTLTATTVRVKDNKVLATDGPFAETKEQLGGYYLLDCENLDEAIELAAKIPHAKNGSIEIRPVMKY